MELNRDKPFPHLSWKRTVHTVGMLVLGAVLAAGCSAPKEAAPQSAGDEVKTVKVAKIGKEQIAEPDEVVAEVLPSLKIDVILKASGDVQTVFKKRGEFVQEGEVILSLDKEDIQRDLEKARVNVVNAQETLAKARADYSNGLVKTENSLKDLEKQYNKMRNDYDLGLVTKFQLEQMETQVNNLRSDYETLKNTNPVAGAEFGLKSAQLGLADLEKLITHYDVKAPISGVLVEMPVEEKMTLNAGFKAAEIQQLDPVKVRAELSEAAYNLVGGKNELQLYIPGTKEKYTGKVSYLSPVVSSQSKAYPLELEVANANNALRPGMRVQVQLNEAKDQEVVVVPTSSIVREGNDSFVFVLVGDHVEKRKVELGRLKDLSQEVLSGVSVDELLVISGQFQLKDKETVKVAE